MTNDSSGQDRPSRGLTSRWSVWGRKFYFRRGLIARAFFCWLASLFLLMTDEVNSYDIRYNLRALRPPSAEVVLVIVDDALVLPAFENRTNRLQEVTEITQLTDSFFWNRAIWLRLLKTLLDANPQRVGVSLYFGENIGSPRISPGEEKVFMDERITWAATYSHSERLLMPTFARIDQSNVGLLLLDKDDDGVIRKLFPDRAVIPHFVQNFVRKPLPQDSSVKINFRAKRGAFTTLRANDILQGQYDPSLLTGKLILIATESGLQPSVQTPLGPLSRGELLGQITDNLVSDRWIRRLAWPSYALYLLLVIGFATIILTSFPQSISVVFMLWFATMTVALSAWVFDTFYIWLPGFTSSAGLAITWFVMGGFQASRLEQRNFELQRERRASQELEQLKNNFVSLISHDLKTPIAKIQSVVGRLMNDERTQAWRRDLDVLHASGEELNKYIRSILSLLRVESQAFRIFRETADVNEIIEEALVQLNPLAEEKNISIIKKLEPLFSVEFDRTLIKEVVINLLDNAIKYSNQGSQVTISSFETDDSVHVEITDLGRGIAPEDLERVWQKFARGSGEDLRSRGTGLGLYLVRYFVELHGGKIALKSQLGQGSTFSFSLPLVIEEKPPIG